MRRGAGVVLVVLAALALGAAGGWWLARSRGEPGEHPAHAGPGSPGDPAAPSTPASWTCSMHPQIQLPGPGACPICGMDLIPGGTAGAGLDPSRLRLSDAARRLAALEVAPVERRPVHRELSLVGKVTFDETRVEAISARFPGRLDRLFVDYTGVPVQAGEHLAEVYSPELLTAQQELLQSLRAAREAGADLEYLRRTTRATVAATREKLRLWGLSPEQIQGIERSGKVRDHLTLYAHQSGIVVEKHQKEGDYVQEGSRIYTVADLSRVWVHLDAYEADLSWIRYRQPVRLTAEAYPGETFEGLVSFIHPVLDERTRTVKVRVIVENPEGRLKPGMFVRGRVRVRLTEEGRAHEKDRSLAGKWVCPMHPEVVEDEGGSCQVCQMPLASAEDLDLVAEVDPGARPPLVVPTTAPLLTGKRALVYVEVPDRDGPTYQGRVVVLGPRGDDGYVVLHGLEEGERVVVRGAFKVDSAVQLQAGPSMMTLPDDLPGGPRSLGPGQLEAARALALTLGAFLAADAPEAAEAVLAASGLHADLEATLPARRDPVHDRLARALGRLRDARGLAALRCGLEALNEAVLLGLRGDPALVSGVAVMRCPMAFDGAGARWIQAPGEVANPYFGASMLRCGEPDRGVPR